jgi:hypothetical protein
MPLIRPEIQQVLRSAGLLSEEKPKGISSSLTEKLDAAGIGLDETLEQLAFVAKESGNESLRVRCLETILKAHGALKESAPAIPSFTIVINGSPSSSVESTGLPNGVNPILLPRQLLEQLSGADTSRFISDAPSKLN